MPVLQRSPLLLLILLGSITSGNIVAQQLEITLKHGSDQEAKAKVQLDRLYITYRDQLTPWVFTTRVMIDETAIPFSHPVLTLNCRYLDRDSLQLANFLHEQFHWFVSARRPAEKKAIEEFRQLYPQVPVGGRKGARDTYSGYLHLIVCDLEFQAMTKMFGEESARKLLSEWTHYTWIYHTVLHDNRVRAINARYGFIVP